MLIVEWSFENPDGTMFTITDRITTSLSPAEFMIENENEWSRAPAYAFHLSEGSYFLPASRFVRLFVKEQS